jgi:hypothetical protein
MIRLGRGIPARGGVAVTLRRSAYLLPFLALLIARTATYATPLECHSSSGWYDASDIDDAANAMRSTTATGWPKVSPAVAPAPMGRLTLLPRAHLPLAAEAASAWEPFFPAWSPRAPPGR